MVESTKVETQHERHALNRDAMRLLLALGVGFGAMSVLGFMVPLTSQSYIFGLVIFRCIGVGLTITFLLRNRKYWQWPILALLGAELIFTTGRVVSLIQSIDALITQAVWVSAYPFLFAGIWGMSRQWVTSKRGVVLQDTLLVFTTCMIISADFMGVKSWEMISSTDVSGADRVAQVISSSFHILDLVMIGMLCRAAISAFRYDKRSVCLMVGTGALMVGDIIWQLPDVNTINTMPARISFGLYQVSFIAFMLSLHLPRIKPPKQQVVPQSIARVAYIEGLLLLACLIIPALASLILSVFAEHHNWPLAIAGSAVLSLVATARLGAIFRESMSKVDAFYRQSMHDPLTGCLNRTGWATALEHAKASNKTYSMMLIDLDHFKKFNDTRGHAAGDELLKEAVIAWKHGLPERAEIARIGGEEFGVVIPDCDLDESLEIAHHLIIAVPYGQTASIGMAIGEPGVDPHALPERADEALYKAKGAGRARVEVHGMPNLADDAPMGGAATIVQERTDPVTATDQATTTDQATHTTQPATPDPAATATQPATTDQPNAASHQAGPEQPQPEQLQAQQPQPMQTELDLPAPDQAGAPPASTDVPTHEEPPPAVASRNLLPAAPRKGRKPRR